MFNFGKGFLKESLEKRQKNEISNQLNSIPEKNKVVCMTKRRKPSDL